ncbi:MAG TPA: EamA family transporter [Candidatus Paceibacterota bacterium]|nr:EamA family transporter [Candidatus Paceibacterota bacterium]
MPTWLWVILVAQFLLAVAAIIDKYIVTSKKVSKPFVYAFYVTILSFLPLALFLLSPFKLRIGQYALPIIDNIGRPDFSLLAMAIVSAFAGFYALFSLYSALQKADASDVVPVVGAVSAVGTFFLSFLVLGDGLSSNFLIGFLLLVIGTAFISHFRFNREVTMLTLNSGLLFSIKATMVKAMFVYSERDFLVSQAFDHAFFWSRIGILIVLIIILFVPKYYEKITSNTKTTKKTAGFWVIGNSILGGIAAFMILKAIQIGNVALVEALGGLKFLFLTVFSILFGRVTVDSLGENNKTTDLWQKSISVILIVAGFFFLFLKS